MTAAADDVDVALPRWSDPAFRSAASAWVGDQLDAAAIAATGELTYEHLRPWAAVAWVPTDGGRFWFKANAIGMRHEAALYDVLVRRSPGHVLEPLALDIEGGWLLLPDGGRTVRDVEGARTDLLAWERMLAQHAQMQRSLEPYDAELLAAGLTDARPEVMPSMRDGLLADDELLLLGQPGGLSREQRDELVEHASTYASQCRDLAAFGIAPTLQHDDLHDRNVFAPAQPGGPLRVFDWGDAVFGHPFGTLLVSLRVVAHLSGLAYGSAELLRLRDSYLEPWAGDYDRVDLVEAARLAVRVGGISRADCYRRALIELRESGSELRASGRRQFADDVPAWLLEQLNPTPLEP